MLTSYHGSQVHMILRQNVDGAEQQCVKDLPKVPVQYTV